MDSVFKDLKQVDERTITFTLTPAKVAYANTLRRAIQTEVSVLGFRADMTDAGETTDVKIIKNSTPMSNEMLADRIGLLPIVMPEGDGWEKNKVLFRLKVVNDKDDVRVVTAADFECLEERADSEERQQVPNTRFFHPDPFSGETCIIAVLKPMIEGQDPEEIHIEAYASLGRGKEHTRFNPTSQCSYGYTRDTDQGKIKELFNAWLVNQKKVDPKELESDAGRKTVLEREFRSLEIYRCFITDEEGEPNSYDFTVETLSTMPVQKIIYQALLETAALADKYSSLDRGDLPESVDIRPADARLKGYDFWFTGEDHTLGNMLQTWLDDNKVGRGKKDGDVTFAGYKVPHPLRNEMVLRIGVFDGKQETARLAVAEAAQSCAEMFRTWAAGWVGTAEEVGLMTLGKTRKPWDAHAEARAKAHAEAKASALAAAQAKPKPKARG
jgi:DNA-directed RNA polymerase subunit L/DNA-directed RNA polymerase alpha subunit